MRVGDLDPGLVEGLLDLALDAVSELDEVLLEGPRRELQIDRRVAEADDEEERLRLVEAERISLTELEEEFVDSVDVLFVGDADLEVEPPDRELRQRSDLGLDEGLVRDADVEVVERPQLDREEVDRKHLAGRRPDLDDVPDRECSLTNKEEPAHEVRSRGL